MGMGLRQLGLGRFELGAGLLPHTNSGKRPYVSCDYSEHSAGLAYLTLVLSINGV